MKNVFEKLVSGFVGSMLLPTLGGRFQCFQKYTPNKTCYMSFELVVVLNISLKSEAYGSYKKVLREILELVG